MGIKNLTRKCRLELDAVLQRYHRQAELIADDRCSLELAGWVTDRQTQLNLFADVMGVFAEGTLSVEHRLRANAAARNAIVQLLEAILHNTRLCGQHMHEEPAAPRDETLEGYNESQHHAHRFQYSSKVQGEKDLSDFAVERVSRDISSLVGFAAGIRLRSMQQYHQRSKRFEPQDNSGIDLLPYFEKVVDRVLADIVTNFGTEEHKLIRQRIKDTIIRRWRRICYCTYRARQLRGPNRDRQDNFSDYQESERSSIAQSFAPGNNPLDPKGAPAQFVPSQRATTFVGSIAPQNVVHRTQSVVSSAALTTTGDIVARVPKLRKGATTYKGGLLEFSCPLCRIPQQINTSEDPARQHRAWEKHAYNDLEPYMCLFDDCETPEITYQSLEDWSAHNTARHAQTTWACQSCPKLFSDQIHFEAHMRDTHQAALSADQMAFVTKACARRAPPFPACLFCNAYAAPNIPEAESRTAMVHRELQMLKCMARHMKLLALTSLPDALSVSLDSASSDARLSADSRISLEHLPGIAPVSTDGHSIEEVHQILARLRGETIKDQNVATAQWRSSCKLMDPQNIPYDHMTLLEDPIAGQENEYVLAASMSGEDCIGSGPPLFDGKPLTFTDPQYSGDISAFGHSWQRDGTTLQAASLEGQEMESQMLLEADVDVQAQGREYSDALSAEATEPSTAFDLGNLYRSQGKMMESEEMYIQALQGYEKALGKEHPNTLKTISNLGILLADQGKLEEAEEMYRRSLQGYEKALGKEHPDTLNTIYNFGILLADQGKWEEAEEMYRRALQGYEKALGKEHPNTLTTISNLGILLTDQGKSEEAEEMYRRALQGYEKALGKEHPNTLNTIFNLGILLAGQGKWEEAEEMYRRALQGYEKALGKEHPDTLTTIFNFGILLAVQGKWEEAEEMYRRALQGYEKALGKEHPNTLNTIFNLGILLADQGKLEEAEEMYKRALQEYEKALGKEHPDTLNTIFNLGILLAGQGKREEAEEMYRRALQGYEKTLGKEHRSTLGTVESLGILYADQGKIAEARKMHTRALQGYRNLENPPKARIDALERRLHHRVEDEIDRQLHPETILPNTK